MSSRFFNCIVSLLLSVLFSATANAADGLVALGDNSSHSCLVKSSGSQLVNKSGKVLVFTKELKATKEKLAATKPKITKLKAQIRSLSKATSKKGKAQLAKARKSLTKVNLEKGKFAKLITDIKKCQANQISAPIVCGNGIVEAGETCDGNCPTSCAQNSCNQISLQGSASTCTATCTQVGVQTACVNGDGCCAPGCNANNDLDCQASCGNAAIEPNENCEGANLNGQSCPSLGFGGGTLSCNAQSCKFNTASCTTCGASQTQCGNSCVDLSSNAANCGACGTQCPGGQVCSNGQCGLSCQVGQVNCGGICTTLASNPDNCGACGTACGAGQSCNNGLCTLSCGAGQTNCFGSCATTSSDPNNCGGCGLVCAGGQTCSGGTCTVACPAGQALCNGSCTNLTSDANNCGACGSACAGGQSCNSGVCQLVCPAGQLNCNGVCKNPNTDVNNCGSCGNVCSRSNASSTCSNGTCGLGTCNSGFGNCDSNPANGCEASLNTDSNCGTCGNNCSPQNASGTCQSGLCTAPVCNPKFCNYDNSIANGCELSLSGSPNCVNANPTFLGSISGDAGSTPTEVTGTGEIYFTVFVKEDSTDPFSEIFAPREITANVNLESPSGTDYDLDVYCASCGGSLAQSQAAAGVVDRVVMARDDTISDNGYLLIIHIRVFSANTCGAWKLRIFPNLGPRTHTCNG